MVAFCILVVRQVPGLHEQRLSGISGVADPNAALPLPHDGLHPHRARSHHRGHARPNAVG